jgi:hypothetical protein
MCDQPLAVWWFALTNLAIVAGYLFIAVTVAPLFMKRVGVSLWTTRLGGIAFFLLCGATHLWIAMAGMSDQHMGCEMATSTTMQIVHTAQAVAVWAFVIGLYVELTDVAWQSRETRTPPEVPGDET